MKAGPPGPAEQLSYCFGPYALVPVRQLLLFKNSPVRLGGRALDILAVLVQRPGELVSKRDLLEMVWPDTVVEEGNLKVHITGLRRVLGEGPDAPQYIATVVGRGYRFVGAVQTKAFSADLQAALNLGPRSFAILKTFKI